MLDYRKSVAGDHAPAECAAARSRNQDAGWHSGWGICAGRVAVVSPFVRRALAHELPGKVVSR